MEEIKYINLKGYEIENWRSVLINDIISTSGPSKITREEKMTTFLFEIFPPEKNCRMGPFQGSEAVSVEEV